MTRKVRSARGTEVDFDLIKIKNQMATAPKPTDVKNRENFIDRKNRRRVKKAPIIPEPILPPDDNDDDDNIEDKADHVVVDVSHPAPLKKTRKPKE